MSSVECFADVPRTPRGHLGLLFYEAAYRVVYHMRCRAAAAGRSLDNVFEEFPFLATYFAELRPRLPDGIDWGTSLAWLAEQREQWEEATPGWLPLRTLQRAV